MTAQIQIKGLDKLVRKIDTLEKMEGVKAAMEKGGKHIKAKIAKYPPESEANVPRTIGGTGTVLPWYERGWGTRYIGGGGVQSSEDLGPSWTIKIRDKGFTVVVGNKVSYAPFVQAHDQQAGFHKKRKWKTDKQVLDQEKDFVIDTIKDDIQKIIDS